MRDFAAQADGFDRRAGLGQATARKIAEAVLKIAEVQPGSVLLEIGAGTGEIGRHLSGGPARYVAIDASAAMLSQENWTERCDGPISRVVADCDRPWPIASGCVGSVFVSRTAHLLDPSHLTLELLRISGDRLCVVIGRVRRSAEGFKELLRTRLHSALVGRGIAPLEGRLRTSRLIEMLQARGAEAFDPVEAAAWPARGTCRQVVEGWRNKPDLAGVEVERDIRDAVLDEVADWARERFGDLDGVLESAECYELSGARLKVES